MKKLVAYKSKEKEIDDVLNLISNSNNGYISICFKNDSKYIQKNIDELNCLLLDESKRDYYINEYKKIGIDVINYFLNGKEFIQVKKTNRLTEIISNYIFM